jgi:hypothetical protein
MDGTRILGWQAKTENGRLKLQLEATLGETPNESKRLTFTLDDGRGHAFQFERPLVNELRQDIASGARYEFETDLQSPQLPAGTYSLTVTLDSRDETHILDGIRSTVRMVLRKTEFGQHRLGTIKIGE